MNQKEEIRKELNEYLDKHIPRTEIDIYKHVVDFIKKDRKQQLILNGVVESKRLTKTDLSRAYQAGCLENVDDCIKYSFKDLKELQQESLEWVKRYTE